VTKESAVSFTVQCPACGFKFRILDKYAGAKVCCDECDHVFVANRLPIQRQVPWAQAAEEPAEEPVEPAVYFQQLNVVQVNSSTLQVRCYTCGLFFDPADSTQRQGHIGTSVDAFGVSVVHFGVVDVCPRCEAERKRRIEKKREEEERERERQWEEEQRRRIAEQKRNEQLVNGTVG
jgi:rubredoxin